MAAGKLRGLALSQEPSRKGARKRQPPVCDAICDSMGLIAIRHCSILESQPCFGSSLSLHLEPPKIGPGSSNFSHPRVAKHVLGGPLSVRPCARGEAGCLQGDPGVFFLGGGRGFQGPVLKRDAWNESRPARSSLRGSSEGRPPVEMFRGLPFDMVTPKFAEARASGGWARAVIGGLTARAEFQVEPRTWTNRSTHPESTSERERKREESSAMR